jgi:hypothetical protein
MKVFCLLRAKVSTCFDFFKSRLIQKSKGYFFKRIWYVFFRASLYMRREENQLDATEWFIALIICSTCFGHFYAHHQEHENIPVLLIIIIIIIIFI